MKSLYWTPEKCPGVDQKTLDLANKSVYDLPHDDVAYVSHAWANYRCILANRTLRLPEGMRKTSKYKSWWFPDEHPLIGIVQRL